MWNIMKRLSISKFVIVCLLLFMVSFKCVYSKEDFLVDLKKLGHQTKLVIKSFERQVKKSVDTISNRIDKALLGLESVAELFDGDEGSKCKYKCSNGNMPTPISSYTPKPNGCGSFGVKVDLLNYPDFTKCCNEHDICYSTCRKDKAICDTVFHNCLYNICREQTFHTKKLAKEKSILQCEPTADLMYGATLTLGCKAYKEAQHRACSCSGSEL